MNNVRRTIPYITFAAGFALGCIVTNNVLRHAELTADQALQIAKETLQKAGPIHSSWIFMKKERLIKNGLTYYTYRGGIDRKSTRLNSSHVAISYAVSCLKT